LIFIFNPVLIATSNPDILIDDSFSLNPLEYIFYEIHLEKDGYYWINMSFDMGVVPFFLNNTNFESFKQKQTFFSIENNRYEFQNDKLGIFAGVSFGLDHPVYQFEYHGDIILVVYNANDTEVGEGSIYLKRTPSSLLESLGLATSPELTSDSGVFLIILFFSFIAVIRRRKILRRS
jgi:hypothetical protein